MDESRHSRSELPEDVPRLFAEAWNRKDAGALARLFAEDADFVNVVGHWWRNRADIERAHDYGLKTFFGDSRLSARRVEVRRLGENAAITHVRWKRTGQRGKTGEVLEDRTTVMVFVAERRDGDWIVVAAHNTDVIPGKETYAAKDGDLGAVDYRN
ncbi:MAG: SgcJ/EcaC family oxidoreductase [Hyphomicrobiales bacterium]|nr:SgcJ/EcaC family oxidoreductase [Hyphomicrobiales bacterium]